MTKSSSSVFTYLRPPYSFPLCKNPEGVGAEKEAKYCSSSSSEAIIPSPAWTAALHWTIVSTTNGIMKNKKSYNYDGNTGVILTSFPTNSFSHASRLCRVKRNQMKDKAMNCIISSHLLQRCNDFLHIVKSWYMHPFNHRIYPVWNLALELRCPFKSPEFTWQIPRSTY